MSNHPPHIINEDGTLSPSAFIPFCEFGGNMSVMGVKIDQFNVPVCNSFKAIILNDQLCYEVDPNLFINWREAEDQIKFGLSLAVDLNEDRQMLENETVEFGNLEQKTFTSSSENKKRDFSIHLETIGKLNRSISIIVSK